MSDHRDIAAKACGIIMRLEREGFAPQTRAEVIALAQTMVNIDLMRERVAAGVAINLPKDE
jgi:hypothetical protein